jgi:hypothetical protein
MPPDFLVGGTECPVILTFPFPMNMYILPDDLEPTGKAIPFMRPDHPLRLIHKGDKKGGQPVGHLQRSSDLDFFVSGAEPISWEPRITE